MKEVITVLKYKENKLIIYKENGNIKLGKITDHKITIPSQEQQKILEQIYDSILIDKQNQIDCGTHKIKGKQIKIYYCTKTNLYYFYELKNNTKQKPDKELLEKLNIYYNNQNNYLYIGKQEAPKTITRWIKINTIWISLIITANIAFEELPVIKYGIYQNIKEQKKEEQQETYSLDKVKQILEENKNLTDEEKNFILLLEDELEENKKYLNTNTIYENLSQLDINYHYKAKQTKEQETILGSFNPNSKDIDIYKTTDQKHIPKTIFHEINHTVQRYDKISPNNPNYIMEATNEIFTKEYFEKTAQENNITTQDSYQSQVQAIYPLLEILDITTFRKYHFNKDNQGLNTIIKQLQKIDPSLTKAAELLTAINSMELYDKNTKEAWNKLCNENGDNEQQIKEYLEKEQEKQENNQKIYEIIKYYYEKKYNQKMTDDQLMMFYFSNDKLNIKEAQSVINQKYKEDTGYITNKITDLKIEPKGYFSKDYKKTHKNLVVKYKIGITEYKVEINNQNRTNKEKIPPTQTRNILEETPFEEEPIKKTR